MQSPELRTTLRQWITVVSGGILTRVGVLLFLSVQAHAGQDSQFRVYVVDPSHESVKRGRVDFIADRDSRTAFTDADGMATFANLPSGRYKVRVSASGFKVWIRDQEVTAEQEHPLLVTLQPGVLGCEPHYWIEYYNQPGSPVRGMVIDSGSGKGIRGMKIQLRRPDEKKPIITLRSQKKGMFEMPQIAPGRYRLRVTDDTEYQDEQMEVVVPTQDTPFITIKLMRKGGIEICL